MSIKSILRAVWPFRRYSGPTDLADLVRGVAPPSTPFLDRLKGRSDWQTAPGNDAPFRPSHPLPIDPAPAVAPWDTHSPDHTPFYRRAQQPGHWDQAEYDHHMVGKSPVWPEHDDPYAKPEPCNVVQDPGLSTIRDYAERTNENTRRLTERGLAGRPMDSVKSVMDLLQLIERQEMAERELIHRGMEWDPVTRRWIDPDTQP